MRCAAVHGAAKRIEILRPGLPGQTVHYVHIEVLEPRLSEQANRILKSGEIMDAAQGAEQTVVRGLEPHGHAVDPGGAVGSQLFLRDRTRVALHRNLRVRPDAKMQPKRPEKLRHLRPAQKGGRAAAEKQRCILPLRQGFGGQRDLRQERRAVVGRNALCGRKGDKVAIGALFDAVWNVQVQPRGLHQLMRKTLMKASLGTCTVPTWRMRFLPSFCFSRSFFLRVMSPP